MSELSIRCEYCVGQDELVKATVPDHVSAMKWRQAWKQNAPTFKRIHCGGCGGTFGMEDDGDPVESGGFVVRKNISTPRIDSLNVTTGPRTGGNALVITGMSLEIGSLVVKFGGQACPIVDNRTVTTASVVVPPATYTLNVLERCHKITLLTVTVPVVVNEAITTDAGSTGIVRGIEGSVHWIAFANLNETLNSMVNTNIVGGTSGGTSKVTAAEEVLFTVGETATGLDSSASGTVSSDAPLMIHAPTGGFAPDELIRGASSGAVAKLTSSPAYSSLVDVTVENEHGQRITGATLPGAYTYA